MLCIALAPHNSIAHQVRVICDPGNGSCHSQPSLMDRRLRAYRVGQLGWSGGRGHQYSGWCHGTATTQSRPGGGGETLADCMALWDAGTHMTKSVWRQTCQRTLNGLDLPDETTVTQTTRTERPARGIAARAPPRTCSHRAKLTEPTPRSRICGKGSFLASDASGGIRAGRASGNCHSSAAINITALALAAGDFPVWPALRLVRLDRLDQLEVRDLFRRAFVATIKLVGPAHDQRVHRVGHVSEMRNRLGRASPDPLSCV